MSTREVRNFLGVYQCIVENLNGLELYQNLSMLDVIAEKSLTFTEFTDYTKQTRSFLEKTLYK